MKWTALFAVAVLGCIDIPSGLEDHLNLLVDDGVIAAVVCAPSTLPVLGVGDCTGLNANGTQIIFNGFAPLTWDSSNDAVVEIDQSGTFIASTSGTSTITAVGTNGSTASTVITVP